jgi:hypothetical protein
VSLALDSDSLMSVEALDQVWVQDECDDNELSHLMSACIH